METINHYHAIRTRIVGSGNLRYTLYSLDDANSEVLTPVVMAATTDREPTTLALFVSQRAAIRGETTAIDETFTINKIILFAKPIETGYPQ